MKKRDQGDQTQMDLYRRLLRREGVAGEMTRRRLVGALGGAAALASAAYSAPVLGAIATTQEEEEGKASEAGPAIIGSGATGQAVLGFIGKVEQIGILLTAVGYLTSIRNVKEERLFTVPRGTSFLDPNSKDESQARFTFHSESEISSLSAVGRPGGSADDLGQIVANAAGNLAFYYQNAGGADFDDAESFKEGTQIAKYSCSFQDNLTLQPPDFLSLASVNLTGHLRQSGAKVFSLEGKQSRLGANGALRAMTATGWGELREPTEPQSVLWIAGILSVVGKDPQ